MVKVAVCVAVAVAVAVAVTVISSDQVCHWVWVVVDHSVQVSVVVIYSVHVSLMYSVHISVTVLGGQLAHFPSSPKLISMLAEVTASVSFCLGKTKALDAARLGSSRNPARRSALEETIATRRLRKAG